MSKLDDLMGGAVGYFWPDLAGAPDLNHALAGHVCLGPEGQMLIDVLSPPASDRTSFPEWVDIPHSLMATTSVAGALFLDVRGVRHQGGFGGHRPSTRSYRCGAVVLDAPINRLRSHDLLSITAFFPGIGPWAGLSASEETPENNDKGALQSWPVKLQSSDDLSERLPSGRALSMSTHWQVDGPMDRRVLYAPISLTVSSKRPSNWVKLVQPLMAIQGLISLAFDGLVLADGGQVKLDLHEDEKALLTTPTWWTARLMRQPPGARVVKSMTEFPSFSLETLGGVAGLRRWVALESKFPRAVGPLVSPHRFGSTNVETRLLEVAAGIEYWVALHRGARSGRRSEKMSNRMRTV